MIETQIVRPSNQELSSEAVVIVQRLMPESCTPNEDWFRLDFIVHCLARSVAAEQSRVRDLEAELATLRDDYANGEFERCLVLEAENGRLREALAGLVQAIDATTPAINNAFVFAHIHGQNYSGPTYGDELETARALLAPQPAPEEAQPAQNGRTPKIL